MKQMRLVLATALMAIALIAAACGDNAPAATGAAEGGGSGGAPAAPFGAGCSQLSSEDVEMMMTEPVVTASKDNPQLTSLVDDLELAGLTDSLNTAEALTVFAPTNAAFEAAAAADPDGMEAMMADPTGDFAELLTYHVVEGQLAPDELAGQHETLQGGTLTVEGNGDSFIVNGSAKVVCGDIHTDNATVYLLDEVLHP